jgi:hypothetical protein
MNRRLLKGLFATFAMLLVIATVSVSRGAGGPTIGNDTLPPDYQIEGPGQDPNPCSTGVNTNCPYCTLLDCGCLLPVPGRALTASCTCACNGTQAVCSRTCTYSQSGT